MGVTGENQLGFQLMGTLSDELRIGYSEIRRLPDNFFLNARRLVHILVFDIKDRIDPMLPG